MPTASSKSRIRLFTCMVLLVGSGCRRVVYTLRSRWHRRNEHRHAAWQAGSETDSLGSTPDKASKMFMYVPISTVGPTVCMGTGLPSGACCYFSASICTSGKFGSMAACMYACRRNLWYLTHKYYGRRSRGAMTMSRHQHARKRADLHTARVSIVQGPAQNQHCGTRMATAGRGNELVTE